MNRLEKKNENPVRDALREYKNGNYEEAILVLASSPATEENYVDYAYIMGLCYTQLKKYDEALIYLEQVVTNGSDLVTIRQCRMTLAYIYSITNRMKLAEYELKKLLDESDGNASTHSALAHAVWKQGRLEEGLKWYGKALELEPENPNALNGYGYLLACAGRDLNKALTYCRKAMDSAPDNPVYADSLGWVYYKLGMMQDAARYLYQAYASLSNIDECKAHINEFEKEKGFI